MPRTSVKIWQRSAPRRAARAMAVVSEPPRPSVVMSVPWTSSPSVRPWKPATMTTLPASISRWTRAGSTLAIRALPWRESVVMPACGPLNEIAEMPCACSAIERSVALWCSPVARRTSSSRSSGVSVIAAARLSSSSVVSPIADTTTTRSAPAARSRAIRRATRRIRSASASDEPPNFCTTRTGLAGIGAFYRANSPARPLTLGAKSTAGRHSCRARLEQSIANGAPGGQTDVLRPRFSPADPADRGRRARLDRADPDRGRWQSLHGVPRPRRRAERRRHGHPAGRSRPARLLRGARPSIRRARRRRDRVRLVRANRRSRSARGGLRPHDPCQRHDLGRPVGRYRRGNCPPPLRGPGPDRYLHGRFLLRRTGLVPRGDSRSWSRRRHRLLRLAGWTRPGWIARAGCPRGSNRIAGSRTLWRRGPGDPARGDRQLRGRPRPARRRPPPRDLPGRAAQLLRPQGDRLRGSVGAGLGGGPRIHRRSREDRLTDRRKLG